MLKSTQRVLRFNYNNFNNWRRYRKNYPVQAEQKEWKKDFKEGDQAEFAYDNKILWPEGYKPWYQEVPYEYAAGIALVILYVDWRTDKIR